MKTGVYVYVCVNSKLIKMVNYSHNDLQTECIYLTYMIEIKIYLNEKKSRFFLEKKNITCKLTDDFLLSRISKNLNRMGGGELFKLRKQRFLKLLNTQITNLK